MKVLPCGDTALLVELETVDEVVGYRAALTAEPVSGVTETVPAARTVLVCFDPAVVEETALAARLASIRPIGVDLGPAATIDVPVIYDGEDLDEVAGLAGIPTAEVIRKHSAGEYVVAFCGFSPGFGYLTGLDPDLHVPRRSSPRTSVPAGSVAIAGEYTAVYPSASPGGWRLIGRTELSTWDVERDPPALLRPGTRVRFRPA